jgi:hypothetical protein
LDPIVNREAFVPGKGVSQQIPIGSNRTVPVSRRVSRRADPALTASFSHDLIIALEFLRGGFPERGFWP